MWVVRLMLSPGLLLALATVIVIVVVEWSVGGVLLGLLGALGGLVVGLVALQLGLLVGAVVLGVRVHRVVVGVGPRLREWGTPGRSVTLRAVPLFVAVAIGPGKAPVRSRMWWAALVSGVAGAAVSAAAVAGAIGADSAMLRGAAVACCLTVGHALVPRKTAGSTSTGWMLLRLRRLNGRQARQLEAAPVVGRAVDAASVNIRILKL